MFPLIPCGHHANMLAQGWQEGVLLLQESSHLFSTILSTPLLSFLEILLLLQPWCPLPQLVHCQASVCLRLHVNKCNRRTV